MTNIEPLHLRPTAPLAERALLPGDPGRALALAQSLLREPRMFNHNRGLWGYTGQALVDDESLTIQSTGMGGPSAAIVLHELIALGVRRAIRVGTCGALDRSLRLGDLLIARETIAADGTSRALGAGERISADGPLTSALESTSHPSKAGTIVTSDLFYEPSGPGRSEPVAGSSRREREWIQAGALAVEMETATLFALGRRSNVPVACVLVVSDLLGVRQEGAPADRPSSALSSGRERIDEQTLLEAVERMGRAAAEALAG